MDKKRAAKNQQVDISVNMDTTPILYTDNIYLTANEDGITLNVGQKLLNSNQIKVVSRIGMSRSHAQKFVAELGKLLAMPQGYLQSGDKSKN